jgi:hypothetical protein
MSTVESSTKKRSSQNLIAYLLILLSSAMIVASIVMIVQGSGFMVSHLSGSVILLGFIFGNRIKEDKITEWKVIQRILAVLVTLYNMFLVASSIILVFIVLVEFVGPVNEIGGKFLLPTLTILFYTFLSIRYHRKVKKLKDQKGEK